MTLLIDCARQRGYRAMIGDVLADNPKMLRLVEGLGFSLLPHPETAAASGWCASSATEQGGGHFSRPCTVDRKKGGFSASTVAGKDIRPGSVIPPCLTPLRRLTTIVLEFPSQEERPAMLDTPVPDFSLPATSGQTFSLAAQAGRIVVLYFYPKDSTPGCTTEAQQFRDLQAEFDAAGAVILGVSRDSLKSHENFRRSSRSASSSVRTRKKPSATCSAS